MDVKALVKILKSKKAYEILDNSKAPETTWQAGGCWILADALSMLFYGLPIYAVYNSKKGIVEHLFVKVGTMYLDSDGMQSKSEMIKKISEESFQNKDFLEIVKFNKLLNTEGIVKDFDASKKLVELLRLIQLNKTKK